MASTYSTDLKIELMVTGENAGTWGDKTNDNLNVIQQAIAGYGEQSIAGGAQTTALTIANSPTLSVARNIVIKLTGTITGNQIITIPDGIEKTWIVSNGTTGSFTVEFKTVSGTGATWTATDKGIKILYSDGTNINTTDLSTLSGTVASAQIANLAVTSSKLASFAVTEARINSLAVTSTRLASFAVTTAKLATNAVTAIKITQSTITQSKLAANSVGSNQLISTGVTAATYTAATITVDADGRITSASSGSGGAGGFLMTNYITGPSSGTFTKNPATNYAVVHAASGQGGIGGESSNGVPGGVGGFGGFSYFNVPMTGPYSNPYSVGGAGNPGNAGSGPIGGFGNPGNAGGVTNFSGPSAFTTNGGNGGIRSNGPPGNPGNAGAAAPGASFTVPSNGALAFVGAQGVGVGPFANGFGGGAGVLVIYENIGT